VKYATKREAFASAKQALAHAFAAHGWQLILIVPTLGWISTQAEGVAHETVVAALDLTELVAVTKKPLSVEQSHRNLHGMNRESALFKMPDFSAFPNPGHGHLLTVAFSNPQRSWDEKVDLVEVLAKVVEADLGPCVRENDRIRASNGLVLVPKFVGVQPMENGAGTGASTVVEVSHPTCFPNGIFEWQHSSGSTLLAAVTSGFEQWAQIDLRALRNALLESDLDLTFIRFDKPLWGMRRLVLSPVMGVFVPDSAALPGEHASGCPCCMLVRCLGAFEGFINSRETFGIRMYAARYPDGQLAVDCRVNGADYQAGAEALRTYAATWQGTQLLMRKQSKGVSSTAPARICAHAKPRLNRISGTNLCILQLLRRQLYHQIFWRHVEANRENTGTDAAAYA
jgi:hypothetical protein